jgi:hypothetical protein
VKQGDGTCPFCGEHISFATMPAARLAVGRLSRSALLAASAAGLALAIVDCSSSSSEPAEGGIDATFTFYPMYGMPPLGDSAVIPLADGDAAGCATTSNPRVVCFGADSAPYETYLVQDAGIAVGQCPTQTDFLSPRGEGSCGFTACGPLLPSAVGALVGDAGAEAGDGGDGQACCFLVVQVCGV